ncbi:MAG: 6-carboxyhexanoate--CoA ligase [Deltaproteobacteria bacterium]|nr:MAG: 6-carboxyhexanoate--CoA ligase [Deltaproteobacteria bacterium]
MTDLYSVRMHARAKNDHLCGAERLQTRDGLEAACLELVRRALAHERGVADQVRISIDRVDPGTVVRVPLPTLETWLCDDADRGRQLALRSLVEAGVPQDVASRAMARLAAGPAPGGGVMRGAMLVDVASGERFEPDPARGVRASRMDLDPDTVDALGRGLAALDLDNRHVREALVLAAKVLAAPGMVAELCWSDDPSYTAGYVAAPGFGYRRFPHLKPAGCPLGGRVFFIDRTQISLAALIDYLERTPVLAGGPVRLLPARQPEEA